MESNSVCNHTSDNKIGRPRSGSSICLSRVWLQTLSHTGLKYWVLICWDRGHFFFFLRDSGNFVKILKIRVKLILNCPMRLHIRIGRHEVLLPINRKNYNFWEKKNSQVMWQRENLHQETDKGCINLGVCTLFLWWLKPSLWLVDVNYNFKCYWLI